MFKRQQQQQPVETPLFETSFLGFWCKVYANRVEFKATYGTKSVSLSQIAGIEAGMSFELTTTGGERYTIPTNKKKELQQAIMQAQANFLASMQQQQHATPAKSIADEIAKLHALWQQGIITQADFEQGKKTLLGQ